MAHHHHTHHRKVAVSTELALASELFDKFCSAATLKTILSSYRTLCDTLNLKPTNLPQFYPKLKNKLCSWRAQALWNKFDKRANHKCYNRGRACPDTRVLIIGAGPCGLRAAIEAQLLGAKVVVIEKRDRITRNNVLHLWPFVINDLRSLGAKKFFGKFCAGSIDHISIRQLQSILLKVALLLGVEIHEGVSFESLIPPSEIDGERTGWRAKVNPEDHPVSQYEFDVLIGADGKRNTLEGFKRKEFRGKLAIAITANFLNQRSEAEAQVEEISGVAYIFNQKFFQDLRHATGIDLENIVYYKDDTHYFVMTAKKHSLLNKGAILHDYADTAKLLSPENINKDALMEYAKNAANFSTNYKLPQLQFAVNHYGQPDVAMFDFTSMYAAENASRIVQEKGFKLLMCLVGDSLLEPFWPTGSGCARGFLSSMDAGWAIRSWGSNLMNPLEVIAERESIYRLLNQTTPENLHRDSANYSLDPHSRYQNLNIRSVLPIQVTSLYQSDDPAVIEQCLKTPSAALIEYTRRRTRRDGPLQEESLLIWLKKQVALYNDIHIEDITKSFKDGLAFCAIIHRYRPDLIDFHSLQPANIAQNNQLAFDILQKEYGLLPIMTGSEMENCETPDSSAMLSYLTQIHDTFLGEIPYIRHVTMDDDSTQDSKTPIEIHVPASVYKTNYSKLSHHQKLSLLSRISGSVPRKRYRESRSSAVSVRAVEAGLPRKTKKRRNGGSTNTIADRKIRFEEIKIKQAENKLDGYKYKEQELITSRILKGVHMLQRQTSKQETDNLPFEDYSMFLYRQNALDFKERVKELERKLLNPDREVKELQEFKKSPLEENFSGRVKDMEIKLKGDFKVDKKPKDLLRAIGKIEKTDWNVKEIEKKIEENKYGRGIQSGATKVPKWNKQQFDDKFTAVKKKLLSNESSNDPKYSQLDDTLKKLAQKLRNGSALEQGLRGANKVSAMAAHLATINHAEQKTVGPKNAVKGPVIISSQGGNEICYFCDKRVYLMERLNAEGKLFHRGCFRCEFCGISLRLGNYSFDRDAVYGGKFYCVHHVGYPNTYKAKLKSKQQCDYKNGASGNDLKELVGSPKIPHLNTLSISVDAPDTPERIEFENLDAVKPEDGDVTKNEMDEDEWTDHNFGTSANELASSDDASENSESEDEENELEFAQALDVSPLERSYEFTRRFSTSSLPPKRSIQDHSEKNNEQVEDSSSDDSIERISYHEFDSEGDESDTATGEEEAKARELRMKEVRLEVPERLTLSDSGSETEVGSEDEYSVTSDDEENSATEISTDSEFERNNCTVIKKEIPNIVISESLPTKKGYLEEVQKIKIVNRNEDDKIISSQKSTEVTMETNIESPKKSNPFPFINPHRGDYYLNRTQSTEGVASKISLELKKKYLLGNESSYNAIKKSDSTSVLDTKFKSFVNQISEHQKLLNPAQEPSLTMQAFLEGVNKLHTSPSISPSSSITLKKSKEISGVENFQHVCDKSIAKEETSIAVPDLPKAEQPAEPTISSDSESSTEDEQVYNTPIALPKVEIHNSQGELLQSEDGDARPWNRTAETPAEKIMAMPLTTYSDQILKRVSTTAELFSAEGKTSDKSTPSTPTSTADDNTLAAFTETELSDWAREDDGVSDNLDDMMCGSRQRTNRDVRSKSDELTDEFYHVCGKAEKLEHRNMDPPHASFVLAYMDDTDIEFMDTLGEDEVEATNVDVMRNSGYVEYVTSEDEAKTPLVDVAEAVNCGFVEPAADTRDYEEFVQRFQERISPFSNVKDSIDVRKSRIQMVLPLSEIQPEAELTPHSRKLEEITRERSKQKNLIHEMVMSKLQSEGKTIDDWKNKRNSRGKSSEPKPAEASPKVNEAPRSSIAVESFSLPDIRKALNEVDDKLTPEPPSPTRIEILKSTESVRQQARIRARLMSDSELGLSPEDKLKLLKQKIVARKAVQSAYYDSAPSTPTVPEPAFAGKMVDILSSIDVECNVNDPALSPTSKTLKDKERRKSIIQAVSDFFLKKSPPKTSKETPSSSLNKLKHKILSGKEKSKSVDDVHFVTRGINDKSTNEETQLQGKFLSESDLGRKRFDITPPPRPPSPAFYSLHKSDENVSVTSVDSKEETPTLSSSKQLRSSRRKARREHQKRLRMAQEIQRKLEEIDVQQKELEDKGVDVEKALRNENKNPEKEYELMQELLDMVRQRNELRKFEEQLILKAREIDPES